jgi:hypothetical protein
VTGWGVTGAEFVVALLGAIGAELDTWDVCFFDAMYAVPAALVNGTIDVAAIEGYPSDVYDEDLSREIARAAGLPFHDEPELLVSGWRRNVTCEHIGSAVFTLRGIPGGDVGVDYKGAFAFHSETLWEHRITIGQVRDYMQTLDLLGAARLIVAAGKFQAGLRS